MGDPPHAWKKGCSLESQGQPLSAAESPWDPGTPCCVPPPPPTPHPPCPFPRTHRPPQPGRMHPKGASWRPAWGPGGNSGNSRSFGGGLLAPHPGQPAPRHRQRARWVRRAPGRRVAERAAPGAAGRGAAARAGAGAGAAPRGGAGAGGRAPPSSSPPSPLPSPSPSFLPFSPSPSCPPSVFRPLSLPGLLPAPPRRPGGGLGSLFVARGARPRPDRAPHARGGRAGRIRSRDPAGARDPTDRGARGAAGMSRPGPRAPGRRAPLRPLLLLLCALAPGAPQTAPGGWPPLSPASADPAPSSAGCGGLGGPCGRRRRRHRPGPGPGRRGPPARRVPTSPAQPRAPSRGPRSEGLDGARSARAGAGGSPTSSVGSAGCGGLRATPTPRPSPIAPTPIRAGAQRAGSGCAPPALPAAPPSPRPETPRRLSPGRSWRVRSRRPGWGWRSRGCGGALPPRAGSSWSEGAGGTLGRESRAGGRWRGNGGVCKERGPGMAGLEETLNLGGRGRGGAAKGCQAGAGSGLLLVERLRFWGASEGGRRGVLCAVEKAPTSPRLRPGARHLVRQAGGWKVSVGGEGTGSRGVTCQRTPGPPTGWGWGCPSSRNVVSGGLGGQGEGLSLSPDLGPWQL